MCLAIPMRLISLNNHKGEAEAGGMKYFIDLTLLPDAKINDYVIVHAGFAIQKLDIQEAEKTLELFNEISIIDP